MHVGRRLTAGQAELAGLRLLALTTMCHLTAPPASWEGGGELLVSAAEQQGWE